MAKPIPGFPGFRPEALQFLRDLAANNNRDWFLVNKSVYEKEVVAPFRLLLADVISALATAGSPLTGDPAKAIFRIHRDVRFSKDKLPGNTRQDPGGYTISHRISPRRPCVAPRRNWFCTAACLC